MDTENNGDTRPQQGSSVQDEPSPGEPQQDDTNVREGFHVEHVKVSETNEGKPWFEWTVAACLLVSVILAWARHPGLASLVVVAVLWSAAIVRSVCGPDSPWKVRSVGFDSFIGVSLGTILGLLFWSIRFLY